MKTSAVSAQASQTSAPAGVSRLEPPDPVGRVIEAVHDDLVFGRLKPRERLVEADMCERYGVSRATVRRALEDLENRGVVAKQPNKGAVVHDFSLQEIVDICDLRILLQKHATETMPLPGAPDWTERLGELQLAHGEAVEARNVAEAYRLNRAFHATFFSATPNAFLRRQIEATNWLLDIVRSYRMLGPALNDRAPREHAAIVDAARVGDRDRLVALCLAHVPSPQEIHDRISAWSER